MPPSRRPRSQAKPKHHPRGHHDHGRRTTVEIAGGGDCQAAVSAATTGYADEHLSQQPCSQAIKAVSLASKQTNRRKQTLRAKAGKQNTMQQIARHCQTAYHTSSCRGRSCGGKQKTVGQVENKKKKKCLFQFRPFTATIKLNQSLKLITITTAPRAA